MRRLPVALALAALLMPAGAHALPDGFVPPAGAVARDVSFADLDGWAADDASSAFRAFRRTCEFIVGDAPPIRRALVQPSPALKAICAETVAGSDPDPDVSRRFFEEHFAPVEITVPAGRNLLTGYYEPDFVGSPVRSDAFATPLLALPTDLVAVAAGAPSLPPGTTIARRRRTGGGLEPYPDRAAIESGALGDQARPLVWVRDAAEALIIQVQGSARIRLPDGTGLRVAYAGRNGQPYSSVARLLVQRLGIDPSEMTADRLTEWLRANPADGRELLARNRSYIFFRIADELGPEDGPVGTAGVPLIAGRSLAVDPAAWAFGLPVWLEGSLPRPEGGSTPLRRLLVAQDSGSAITGPTRGDLFVGSGEAAGRAAGILREDVRFVVLWAKPDSTSPPR